MATMYESYGWIIDPPQYSLVTVFSCGGNRHMQLAQSEARVDVPTHRYTARCSEGFVQIALGRHHGVGLTLRNKLRTWGSNAYGQLGRSLGKMDPLTSAQEDRAPNYLDAFDTTSMGLGYFEWAQVAATATATFALSTKGMLFGCGTLFEHSWNDIGEVVPIRHGIEPSVVRNVFSQARMSYQIKSREKIIKIAAGEQHIVVLTVSGKVFTYGSNNYNQLGRSLSQKGPTRQNTSSLVLGPIRLKGNRKISDIGAGSYHSYAICKEKKEVFGWGMNSHGQTGVNGVSLDDDGTVEFPALAECLSGDNWRPLKSISGTKRTGLAVTATDQGEALVWGSTAHGILGLPLRSLYAIHLTANGSALIVPQRLGAIDVEFGTTGKHGGMIIGKRPLDNGKSASSVYSWGDNSHHMPGHGLPGSIISRYTLVEKPLFLKKTNAQWAACGRYSSFIAVLNDPTFKEVSNTTNFESMREEDDDANLTDPIAIAERNERLRFKEMLSDEREEQNQGPPMNTEED
ncbi:MAG: Regulator of chromosome condensation [Vezdaea aestivalis]|nr:MAG: Regulator of chromosome condensation [Vezdaea aestivalis]